MVAVRHLVLLAALAIVGEAANYDIFKVIDAMTMLTRQDLIDIIKAAEEAFKLGKSRDDVIRMNGPLHYKFRMLRAELRKLSTDEQNVIGKLLAIAREVLDRRVSDVEASNRIMEAFRNGGQGLCARYPRIPGVVHNLKKAKFISSNGGSKPMRDCHEEANEKEEHI
ncbi:unnamed protein product [Nippostrongylus brasiliensis]|uniref:Uncharacterized protein n=1 Tax=Nippostrongylus brasiliensis TaxID=27835 RepID=A0A0N4Y0R9_NIPBR|nr:unnamed protein product [Nippostrongylus brasiliensis]